MPDQPRDFDRLLRRDYAQELPGMAETQFALGGIRENVERLGDIGARSGAARKDQPAEKPQTSYTFNADGTMNINKIDQRTVEGYTQAKQRLDEILGSFHQNITQLQAQEDRARQQPWQQLATTLSANLAQAKDMPGWVQGLGRTAAQLNPTVQELQMRKLGLMKEEAGMAEKGMALGESAQRTQAAHTDRMAALEEKKQQDVNKAVQSLRLAAKPGGKPMTKAQADDWLRSQNIKDQSVLDLAYKGYVGIAETSASAKEQEQDRKKELIGIKTADVTARDQKLHGYRQAEIAQRLEGSMDRLGKAQEFNAAMKDYSASLAEDKALVGVDRQTKQRLVDLKNISRYTGSTRALLDLPEMKGYEGPLTPERLLPRFFQSANLVKYNEWVNLELPRINALIHGGVRMIASPQGRDFIAQRLGFTTPMTADQIRGILDNADKVVENEQMSIMDGTPRAPWKRYPELLGTAYPYADVLAQTRSTPRPSPPSPTAGKAAGTGAKSKTDVIVKPEDLP